MGSTAGRRTGAPQAPPVKNISALCARGRHGKCTGQVLVINPIPGQPTTVPCECRVCTKAKKDTHTPPA
jgi:hypothetical protein